MAIYCLLKEKYAGWRMEDAETQNAIKLLVKLEDFQNNLDGLGYLNGNLLPEWIESLQVSDEDDELIIYTYKWANDVSLSSNELFVIQPLPSKKWAKYWDSLCMEGRIKTDCLDYISSIIRISQSLHSSMFVSLNR